MSKKLTIRLEGVSLAEQSSQISDLSDVLNGVSEIDEIAISRERPDSQDPGTILTIVLAAPAVIAAVKAIASWATRSNQGTIIFETDGKRLAATNLRSEDVPKIAKAIQDMD